MKAIDLGDRVELGGHDYHGIITLNRPYVI